MSLSSYIKRQSRVLRNSTVSAFGLASISEEESESTKSSVKAKRRLGVSDLCIPPLASFENDLPALHSSSDDDSGSSSSSSSSDGLPRTPTPSPTEDSYIAAHAAQAIIRCKSIKPLAVSKRSVSPVPTLSSEEDDDVYYAAHAGGYITLRRSSSLSTHAQAVCRRESAVINRRFSIPSRPPPPPPIDTSVPNFSRPTAVLAEPRSRPPPRTPVPTDAWSGDYTDVAVFLSASPATSTSGSSISSSSPFSFSSPASTISSSSSTTSLDALLSPPPQFPPEVPCDILQDEGEWEECALDDEVYDDIPLSPSPLSVGAPAPSPVCLPEPTLAAAVEPEPTILADHSPAPAARSRTSQHSHSHQLRSRWSSSTLSSVHSVSARGAIATSPKTFAFAKRYLRVKTPGVLNLKSPSSPFPSTPKPKTSPKRRPGKKRLTAKDVVVMHQGQGLESPPPPPVPAKPKSLPLPLPLPKTPASASAQWASYPSSPPPAPYIPAPKRLSQSQSKHDALYTAFTTQRSPRRRSRAVSATSAVSGWSFSTSSSASEETSSGIGRSASACGSESGHSEWSSSSNASIISSGSSDMGGLRRKPIPVEMFLR
ncbi:hypothetical protein C8F01DRAFT_376657 [Mycena amicta]|nr:hypothetical protein C8F01DRAFT_376657 [Mycena amicta]